MTESSVWVFGKVPCSHEHLNRCVSNTFLPMFPSFWGAGWRQSRHHYGAVTSQKTKRPFQSPQQPYPTPTHSRGHPGSSRTQPGVIRESVCTYTAVQHSQENIKLQRKAWRRRNYSNGWNKNQACVSLLPSYLQGFIKHTQEVFSLLTTIYWAIWGAQGSTHHV